MTNIVVQGTPAQIKLVVEALSKSTLDIDAKLRHPYRIEFHTANEFIRAGYVFPNGKPNWGRVHSARVLWINSTRADRKPYQGQYVVIHELFHALDSDWNTAEKHARLIELMPSVKPGTPWKGGPYLNKPREIYADAGAEAVGIGSPLDSDYGDIPDADLPKLITITFEPVPSLPVDPDIPDPLPLPDPDVAILQARVVALESAMDTIHELSARAA